MRHPGSFFKNNLFLGEKSMTISTHVISHFSEFLFYLRSILLMYIFYILPWVSGYFYIFLFLRCPNSQTQGWCRNIWWLSKLLTLDWPNSSFVSFYQIPSHLISFHLFLINNYWLLGGHCAGCCTLTLRNFSSQVKQGNWYRGRERAKREVSTQETKNSFQWIYIYIKKSEQSGGRSI